MLVQAFGASTFGLRGGVPMEAAQTNVDHAPASSPFEPPTRQEVRGVAASFKGVRVHWTHKGEDTGHNPVSREGKTLFSIRAPYPRLLIALLHRFRSCTGALALLQPPGAYIRWCACTVCASSRRA